MNYFFILFLSYLNFLVVILINLMICVALRLFCKMYTDRGQPQRAARGGRASWIGKFFGFLGKIIDLILLSPYFNPNPLIVWLSGAQPAIQPERNA